MSNKEDREIRNVRLRLLDVVKSFFAGEPDAEKLSRWRGIFSALTKERVNPVFDQSVRDIHTYLEKRSLPELQEEYYELFINPFSEKQLATTASFYLEGRGYGQTLVELRSLFAQLGIEKKEGVTQEEDSLVVMLDVLARLIDEADQALENKEELKDELLQRYLLPLSKSFNSACEKSEAAVFYKACSDFFCGYLELEKGLSRTGVTH